MNGLDVWSCAKDVYLTWLGELFDRLHRQISDAEVEAFLNQVEACQGEMKEGSEADQAFFKTLYHKTENSKIVWEMASKQPGFRQKMGGPQGSPPSLKWIGSGHLATLSSDRFIDETLAPEDLEVYKRQCVRLYLYASNPKRLPLWEGAQAEGWAWGEVWWAIKDQGASIGKLWGSAGHPRELRESLRQVFQDAEMSESLFEEMKKWVGTQKSPDWCAQLDQVEAHEREWFEDEKLLALMNRFRESNEMDKNVRPQVFLLAGRLAREKPMLPVCCVDMSPALFGEYYWGSRFAMEYVIEKLFKENQFNSTPQVANTSLAWCLKQLKQDPEVWPEAYLPELLKEHAGFNVKKGGIRPAVVQNNHLSEWPNRGWWQSRFIVFPQLQGMIQECVALQITRQQSQTPSLNLGHEKNAINQDPPVQVNQGLAVNANNLLQDREESEKWHRLMDEIAEFSRQARLSDVSWYFSEEAVRHIHQDLEQWTQKWGPQVLQDVEQWFADPSPRIQEVAEPMRAVVRQWALQKAWGLSQEGGAEETQGVEAQGPKKIRL